MIKHRKLKVKNLLLLISILVLIVFLVMMGIKLLINNNDVIYEDENIKVFKIKRIHEIGKSEFEINNNDKYSSYINYPIFELENIDKVIKENIDIILNDFVSEYVDENDRRLGLNIDYSSYKNNNIVSLVLHYKIYDEYLANNPDGIKIINFNLEEDKALSNDDIFKSDYKDILAGLSNRAISNDKLLDEITTEQIKNIYFKDGEINLLFEKNTVAASSDGIINIKVDEGLLKDKLKISLKESENIKKHGILSASILPSKINLFEAKGFSIDKNKKMIALSFDDGPNYTNTSKILDVLDKYKVNVTFFVLGVNVNGNEEVIKRSYKMGNEIGNHSFDHKSLASMSSSELDYEINETNRLIKNVIGKDPKCIRPPYGAYDRNVIDNFDMPIVLWNIDTEDWKSHDPKEIIDRVKSNAKDGSIVLMHDIYEDTANSVEDIVKWLIDNDYQIVTVKELMKNKNIPYEGGKIYFSANDVE